MTTTSTAPEDSPLPLKIWYPVFRHVFPLGFQRAISAQVLLGERKKVERANDVKGVIRNLLRVACEEAAPFLTLVEAEECSDFDYLRASWDGTEVACRWGRIPSNGQIRRNTSTRNTQRALSGGTVQMTLFPALDLDKKVGNLNLYTLGYTVEDDFTLGGVPQGWMSKLQLCREWFDETEIVETVAQFEPEPGAIPIDGPAILRMVRGKASETDELRSLVQKIRKTG